MPIIATAGHVDHGKSTLIEALTGRDPDRWAEEKERGLTIDLGFAWRQIGGFDVGFVDVPGHERFIKNMLAGVGAIDVALFVVAADEGWMPQTEEHFSVLDLLDTRHGVVAITRSDLADADTIDLVELEIIEKLEGTALVDWPIVRVSATTGAGMTELVAALADELTAAGLPADHGRPRLWIDRSFHISGAGLVVTGTLSGGTITSGEELMLWPAAAPVRVRGMQHHDAPIDVLPPGTRAALNITGADTAARGMLLGRPGAFSTTMSLLTTMRQVRGLSNDLTARGAYHLHVGSGSWPIRLRMLDTDTCVIRATEPVPLQVGDRLILRETGRKAVVGGGRVLDPHPPQSASGLHDAAKVMRAALEAGPADVADALLEIRGTAGLDDLFRDSGGGKPTTRFCTGDTAMADEAAAALLNDVIAETMAFHAENRLRPGIPKAVLGSGLRVDANTVSLIVAGSERLVDDGATVRLSDFETGLSVAEATSWAGAQRTLAESLAVPRASQLGLETELIHALVRDDRLIRVAADLVYLPEQIERITASLSRVVGGFTVAEFRDLIGVTRRQAVPLLEWLDKQGVTRRTGDTRTLRSNPN